MKNFSNIIFTKMENFRENDERLRETQQIVWHSCTVNQAITIGRNDPPWGIYREASLNCLLTTRKLKIEILDMKSTHYF
jgi:hypothetical protein